MIVIAVLWFTLLFPERILAAGDTAPIRYGSAEGNPAAEVYPQTVGDREYLFLPSSADYSDVYLISPDTAVLTGSVDGASISVGENDHFNLTQIFGDDMRPGEEYDLSIKIDGEISHVFLIKSENIPALYLSVNKTVEGLHVNKSVKGSGELVLVNADGSSLEGTLKQIKGRGNSSWYASGEKRPYNIKLDKKAELIPGAGKAKNWCLLSNNVQIDRDRTGLANLTAFGLFDSIQGDSALTGQSVDLYINNEYRGTYYLTEKVEIHEERVALRESEYEIEDEDHVTRVIQPGGLSVAPSYFNLLPPESGTVTVLEADSSDPAIAAGVQAYQYATGSALQSPGGYILELDVNYYLEASWFLTRQGVTFVLKDPEYATREQVQAIAAYVQGFEDALYSESGYNSQGRHYSEYADLCSFARHYILDCFLLQGDMYVSSCFFYVDADENGKVSPLLKKGPLWDCDAVFFGSTGLFVNTVGANYEADGFGNYYNSKWVTQLLKKGDFVAELNRLSEGELKSALERLLNHEYDGYVDELRASQKMNGILWNNGFTERAGTLKGLIENRFAVWYDTTFSPDHLLGVTISAGENGLSAAVGRTAASYQWYIVDVENGYVPVAIDGATESTYRPDAVGLYYVAATGANIGYNQYAAENPERYTTNGILSVVAQPDITMTSNAVEWTRPSYGVTVAETQMGSVSADLAKAYAGEFVRLTVTPETGYRLVEGSLRAETAEGSVTVPADGVFEMPPADVTVSAVFEKIVYLVSFDANGHGTAPEAQSVTHGEKAQKPADPAAAGYTFWGWYRDSAFTETWSFEEDTVTGTLTLFAKWTANAPASPSGTVRPSNPISAPDPGEPESKKPEPEAWENPYADLSETEWYYDAVKYVTEKGMYNGYPDGGFHAEDTASRAMLVVILWRLEGEPGGNPAVSFRDVEKGVWYDEAVRWVYSKGIVYGYGGEDGGLFGTNDPISREQLATILYRYAQTKGKGFEKDWVFPLDYPDAEEVSEYAREAFCWFVMNGVIQGTAQRLLAPKASASRAETAAILMRFCGLMENKDLILSTI